MGKIIAIANQKGGVGKTTSCINLAASLVAHNRRVLLVDIDPQGNATMGSGIDKNSLNYSINDVLLDEADIHQALLGTQAGYDLVPANDDLTFAELSLMQMSRKEYRLSHALAKLRCSYDYILIDCPPSVNMLTINAMTAANGIVVPMQCEYYSLEGLTGLVKVIDKLRANLNPKLELIGLLRTMYDARNNLTNDVSEQLFKHFGDKVYQTVIPRNVRLAEAPSFGLPALLYDKRSQGAQAYLELADELLKQQEAAIV
ncbi:MAG: chromosome partitioning protein Soj [Gammaproteobacteria bacterium]|nr:chromosome partitioning protein Soj [Gammaproteobacteria bacterium]